MSKCIGLLTHACGTSSAACPARFIGPIVRHGNGGGLLRIVLTSKIQPATPRHGTVVIRWRALVTDFEGLASNPIMQPDELDSAQGHLHALLGQVTLKPKDGVLWAHPVLNAKGLAEASPLHIKVVAGARYSNYMQIEIEPFPLIA